MVNGASPSIDLVALSLLLDCTKCCSGHLGWELVILDSRRGVFLDGWWCLWSLVVVSSMLQGEIGAELNDVIYATMDITAIICVAVW